MKEKSTTTSGEKPLALGVWWALWIVRAFAMLLNWSAIVVMVILSVTVLVMAGMENQPPWLFDVVLAGGGLLLLLGNVMLVFAAGIERAQRTSGDAVPQMSGGVWWRFLRHAVGDVRDGLFGGVVAGGIMIGFQMFLGRAVGHHASYVMVHLISAIGMVAVHRRLVAWRERGIESQGGSGMSRDAGDVP
ncbi:hypothetical protein [Luteolibacter sp. LG18]|uniref:hypothetical protein n=1 Tax=Luteolibacter sp. LG18 TaxID=2819286 RepID=UPI002B28A29B|nr:hypothetical protein llg_29350 [Luteolibacter sp. LG18]